MGKKILIVGGVAGGASTAARLRRLDETAEIIMFEMGEYISFANCGLPYYIGDTITEREKLLVQTVEEMHGKFNIDVRIFSEVTKIDKDNKKIQVKNVKTGETYEETYDYLVLSPGASPIKPPIEGIKDCKNLFTLRNVPDTDVIKSYIKDNNAKTATIVGGGFIGLEMMENLSNLGIKVTLVEMLDQVMAPIDFEMAAILHEHIRQNKVDLILGDGVKNFANNGHSVFLNSGKEIKTDLIILSIGIRPETRFVQDSGIVTNKRGYIQVNDYMQTNDESIYALGDAVCIKDYITKQEATVALAWPANRQGHLVADNICGMKVKYNGTLGSSVAKVFDLTVASTGKNEKCLKALNLPYQVLHIHPGSHAGYYPGAFPIALKLIFSPEGKIYGAQGVGVAGVDKRIDVIATAIKGNLSVYDLPDLELCYAPPYSSAKDPVNMAGYDATNILTGFVKTCQWHEIDEIVKKGNFLIDVRDDFELSTGYIEGMVNIPLTQIRDRIKEIPKNKTIYVYCQVGLRGYLACRILTQLGYDAVNLDGGYKTYSSVHKGENIMENNPSPDTQKASVPQKELKVADINTKITLTIDACGLQCPGPIRRVFEEMNKMNAGEVLEVKATDPGFSADIGAWCKNTGNTLLFQEIDKKTKVTTVKIAKGTIDPAGANIVTDNKNDTTIVVFSGELDKAIASFIIATGAASMGKEVTMFFTFWGLNILKKKKKPHVKKDFMSRMFGFMLPKNPNKLPLSTMNMGGLGPKMIKKIMKKKNVDSIEVLMAHAKKMNIKLVACAMSMDLMGIDKSELIDEAEVAGVASYLAATNSANHNLFI
jgi:CoA-disulfide reductase